MTQAAIYDVLLGAANPLRQIQSAQFSPSNQIEPIRISGALDPSDHTVTGADPRSRITTSDVHNVIGYLGSSTGLYLAADQIIIPRNIRASGGTFLTLANHEKLAGTKALILPISASVNQGDARATAEVEIIWLSTDGFVVPVTSDTLYTLPASAVSVEHLLGDVFLDSSQVTGVTGISVEYGITATPIRTDGAIYAHDVFIQQRDPVITITVANTAVMQTVGPMFASATTLAVFMREKSTGGTVIPDITATHCGFSFGAGIASIDQFGGSGNDSQEVGFRVTGRSLTVSNASAIA